MDAGEPDRGLSAAGGGTAPEDEGQLVRRLRRSLAEADARIDGLERELEQWRSGGPEEYRRHRAKLKRRLETTLNERRALEREVSVLRSHLRQLSRVTAPAEPQE